MKHELEQKLKQDFPQLYRYLYESPQITCMAFGIQISDGWFQLLYDLSTQINNEINKLSELDRNKYYFVQIKEKFASLRIYMSGTTKNIDNLITAAEEKSQTICEFCGESGKLRDDLGWILTLCENDYLKRKK